VQYSGDFYADAANQQRIPGHALFNAGCVGRRLMPVTIDLRGENLFTDSMPTLREQWSQWTRWRMGCWGHLDRTSWLTARFFEVGA